MEVVAAAPRCQLLLIMLMASMLLPRMKGSPLLIQRTVTRTIVLQETIGQGSQDTVFTSIFLSTKQYNLESHWLGTEQDFKDENMA
ncbi:hypothetical protein STEG23_035050 [Scotinomys teguina]